MAGQPTAPARPLVRYWGVPRLMFALVALLAACGRVGFEDGEAPAAGDGTPPVDAPVCATLVHDEDGDGVDDVCDVCPHLADGGQADGDGDRVGDACDPEPTVARQRIVLFDPFTSLAAGWVATNASAIVNDELVVGVAGGQGQLRRALTRGHDTFIVGGTAGTPGAGQHLLAIITAPATPPGGMYCELFDSGTDTTLFVTYSYDNITFRHPAAAATQRLAGGSGTFSYELGARDARCRSTWRGGTGTAAATVPTDIAVEALTLYAENIELRLRYFVQIATLD